MSADPFSRRRAFTYIAIALIIGVTAPFAAYAATGSSVNITDPTTASRKVHVTASGQLLTNTVGKVTIVPSGTQNVAGGVTTAPKGEPFNAYAGCSNAGGCTYYFPAATTAKTYRLTSISLALSSTVADPLTFMRMEWGPYAMMYSGNGIILNSPIVSSTSTTNYYAGSTPVDMVIQVPAAPSSMPTTSQAGLRAYAANGTISYSYFAITGYVY
jgi:hypothetical protein